MVTAVTTRPKAQNTAAPEAEKRVILSMGGKGGVGKTSVISGLAEWFAENEIPVSLLDLDSENKSTRISRAFLWSEGAKGEHPHTGGAGRICRSPG